AGEGVVLAAVERVPGDHGELAGDSDGGDVAAAPRGDAFVEGARRAGGAGGVPGRLDQDVPGLARTLLGDAAVPGRLRARLTHPRVETEVADEMSRGREAADVADRGEQGAGGAEVDAREGQQPTPLR